MFRPDKLSALLRQKGLTNKELFEKAQISAQAWRDACSGGDIGIRKVERIAGCLGVTVDYFFEPEVTAGIVGHNVNGIANNVSGDIITGRYETEIAYLKKLLEEKERTIQLLMKSENAG